MKKWCPFSCKACDFYLTSRCIEKGKTFFKKPEKKPAKIIGYNNRK